MNILGDNKQGMTLGFLSNIGFGFFMYMYLVNKFVVVFFFFLFFFFFHLIVHCCFLFIYLLGLNFHLFPW
jgi:hypothetical protein